jgi:Pyruvate/2-oxoacid:ferredoxin oxidoreductase delta subunit
MALTDEGRDSIRRANQRRNNCARCGGPTEVFDGSKVDGMPGIQYRYCNGCGQSRPITQRPRREKLR